MGSKVIGFRCPDDLAQEFAQFCEGADKTTGEVLRKLVDDMLYPGSGQGRLRERLEANRKAAPLADLEQLYGVEATKWIAEQVNTKIKEQLKEQLGDLVDEHLQLVQIDRGLTEADREHYDDALASLRSDLANLKIGVNVLVQTVNNNVEVCNEHFVKVARLFQFLAAHIHDGDGAVAVSPEKLLKAEVELADKRLGKIEGQPSIIKGKTGRPGYRYLEYINLSVKE